jgi:hypothetical protein
MRTGISEAHCSILALEGVSLVGAGGVSQEGVAALEVEFGEGVGREPEGDGFGRVPISLGKWRSGLSSSCPLGQYLNCFKMVPRSLSAELIAGPNYRFLIGM